MDALIKNKYLNIIITIIATLVLFFVNASDVFIIRLIIKIILFPLVCICLFNLYNLKTSLSNNYFYFFGVMIIAGTFFINPASNKVNGVWVYKPDRILDYIYKMEIKEDNSFLFQEISKASGRVLYEYSDGFISIIKDGKGISKESSLIEFNIPEENNSKKYVKKYLVFNKYELLPPPVDPDYGNYDYFPYTPVNEFEGKWERE